MKHLKLFFALFAMLALGVGNAWAETSSITFSEKYNANTQVDNTPIAITEGITATFTKGKSTATQYYTSGSAIRWYGGGGLNITSTIGNITAITITYTQTANSVSTNVGSYTLNSKTGSWSGNASSIQFTQSGTSGHCRISKIEVTYTPSSSGGGENPGEGEEPESPGSQSTATLIVGENGGVTWTNGAKTAKATVGDVVFTALGSGSNDSKYYSSDKSWRFYTANTSGVKITTPEGSKIVSVIIKWKTGQPNTPTNWSKSGTSSPTTFTPNSGINTNEVSFTRNSSANFLAQEITVNYETSSSGSGTEEPIASLTANPTSLDFGNVIQNTEVEAKTFTISGSDFTTGELTITAPSGYTVNPTTVPVNGTLEETTITVTPNTSTIGTFNDNVTISGANLKSSVTVALTMTVEKAPATPTDNVYVKVTTTAGITDGEYLIVYEDETAPVAFDGSLATLDVASNNIAVTISSNTIAGNTDIDAATFTIDATAGTIKSASGYYIGKTASGNGMNTSKTTAYTNTITIDASKNAVVKSSGNLILRYNKASDQKRFRYFGSGQEAIALYKKASEHTVTIATCTNGSVEASVANDAKVLSGTTITLSNTPATDYKLTAYDVYKTGEESTKVTVADDNTFIMPEFDVTISATFELAKTLTGIEITNTATQTTFWQGETFNYTGLEVTAHFDGAADEVVTPTVTGSTATAGTQTVTVSYNEGATTKTATYNITVKAIPNTQETAYTVADAYDIIDKLTTAEGVFISGIISQVDSYNSTHKSITYWISADGTTTKQLQVYSGKGLESADFSDKTDLSVGDQVIVCGNLKKYDGTYEFDKNNYLAEHTKTTKADPELSYTTTEYNVNLGDAFTAPTLNNPHTLAVTYSSSNEDVATVAADGAVTIKAAGTVTITASFAGDENYVAGEASYTINVTDPSVSSVTFDAAVDIPTEGLTLTKNGISMEFTAGTMNNGEEYRCNASNTMTISYTDGFITKVVLNCLANGTTKYGPGCFTTTIGSYSYEEKVGTWTGEAKSVVFTSGQQVRMTTVTVYYKQDNRADAGLAWNPATVSLTVGDAFTAPTFSNPNSVTGITFTSDNENLATVNNAGAISLVSGKTGTATITATFTGNENYKEAEVKCTISVSPKTENVVILAQYAGNWYALMAQGAVVDGVTKTDRLAALSVEYFNGTLYNVTEADKALITWERVVTENKATFKNGTNYLVGSTSTTLSLDATAFDWAYNGETYLSDEDTRTFLYHKDGIFRNYGITNASDGIDEEKAYSALPVVTAAKFETATFYTRSELTVGNYGTICLPYAVNNFTGATFYKVAGKEGSKIVFDEVTELEAGKPYIFMAETTEIKLAQVGDEYTGNAQLYNSLQGTFEQIVPAAENALTGNYVLNNNIIKKCGANCGLKANRAYFVATELENNLGAAPQPMPGRRRVSLNTTGENAATGIGDVVVPTEQATKVIINGQLIIIRNGEKFNVQGQRI